MGKFKLIVVSADEYITGEFDNVVTENAVVTKAKELLDKVRKEAIDGTGMLDEGDLWDTHISAIPYDYDIHCHFDDFQVFKYYDGRFIGGVAVAGYYGGIVRIDWDYGKEL